MDGRLSHDDKVTDHHTDGDDHPVVLQSSDKLPDIVANGQKTDIHAGKKENQSKISIQDTDRDLDNVRSIEP